MNTLSAALCTKPVIGVAMWLMTLCASNQALKDRFIDLGQSGVLLSEAIDATMDEPHRLLLVLRPADNAPASQSQELTNLLCAAGGSDVGVVTPVHLTFRLIDAAGRTEASQTYQPTCQELMSHNPNTLLLGTLDIKKGPHRAELVNNMAISNLAGKRLQVLLVGTGAGFP